MPDPVPEPQYNLYLAAERTLLAWIRTGLALMGFGFVVARFGLFLREMAHTTSQTPKEHGGLSVWFGTVLILIGAITFALAAFRHVKSVDRILNGEKLQPRRWSLSVILALFLALLGVGLATYLLVM